MGRGKGNERMYKEENVSGMNRREKCEENSSEDSIICLSSLPALFTDHTDCRQPRSLRAPLTASADHTFHCVGLTRPAATRALLMEGGSRGFVFARMIITFLIPRLSRRRIG